MRIGKCNVGTGWPCYIICEIGGNHNGDIDIALEMISIASECGVDAVKFQKRDPKALLPDDMYSMPYEGPNSFGKTYGEHREALELKRSDYVRLRRRAREKEVHFIVSPWDIPSALFMSQLDLDAVKVASASVTNENLLKVINNLHLPTILSTGMSTLDEIRMAVHILSNENPDLAILHCISAYPFDDDMANLRVINRFKLYFPHYPIGYSGHEKSGTVISLGAVAMGACILERHFTLDRSMRGSDHAASLEPDGMAKLVRDVRKLESAYGSGEKTILSIEEPVRKKLARWKE